MAIIKTIIDGNTRIHILDDAYAQITPDEIAAMQQRFQRKVNELAFRLAMSEFDGGTTELNGKY